MSLTPSSFSAIPAYTSVATRPVQTNSTVPSRVPYQQPSSDVQTIILPPIKAGQSQQIIIQPKMQSFWLTLTQTGCSVDPPRLPAFLLIPAVVLYLMSGQEQRLDQKMYSDFVGKLRQLMTLLLGERRLQGLGYPGIPEDQVRVVKVAIMRFSRFLPRS